MSRDFKVLLVYSNAMMDNMIPLNISYLSACLKSEGFDVRLFDTTFYKTADRSADEHRMSNLQVRPFDYSDYKVALKTTNMFEDFIETVSDYKPDLIGLSVVEATYELGLSLIRKASYLKIPTVVGGIHAIFSADEIILEDCVDMVCVGEGEETLIELCSRMRDGRDYSDVKNLWVKKDGIIQKNPLRKLVELDSLPFQDFTIYEEARFYRPMQGKILKMAPVEIDRGCPYTCAYCCSGSIAERFRKEGRWYRRKSIIRVMDEINFQIAKHRLNYLYFVSDTFLAMSDKEFNEFCSLYKQIMLPFWFNTRPETVTESRISRLEEINCHRVSIGLESGDEDFRRKTLKRGLSNKRIIECFKILEKSKIGVSVNNIIGFPQETREQIFKTIELNRQIKADAISVFMFSPYRGTPLRETAVREGYIKSNAMAPDPCVDYILDMPHMSRAEVKGLLRTFPLYVRLPSSYSEKIKKAELFNEEGNRAFEELSKIYRKEFF